MVLLLLAACFLLLYAALFFVYLRQWQRVPHYLPSTTKATVQVSVIIAARNEEDKLPLLLRDLHRQTYPPSLFEVIVVNDFSTDGTGEAFEKNKQPNFKFMQPAGTADASSKKKAIATGIAAASGALMLITDADCRVREGWVAAMAGFYCQKGAAFIAAPVAYHHNGSLLQVFQTLDFLTLQGITAASVNSGFHSMCNGANLAYTKAAFEAVRGFEGIDKIATGDDMLLMHKISKRQPGRVFYLKDEEAIVTTAPATTWVAFFLQRKRWASKALVYDDYRVVAVLAFVLLFNVLFFVLLAAGFFAPVYWVYLVACLVGKALIEWPFVLSVARFYRQQKLLPYFLLFQPLHIIYTVFIGLLSQFGKYEWKGRKTR